MNNVYMIVQTGTRTVMNTDWPIETYLRKSGQRWQIDFDVCNGTASHSKTYRTKLQALAAMPDGPTMEVKG